MYGVFMKINIPYTLYKKIHVYSMYKMLALWVCHMYKWIYFHLYFVYTFYTYKYAFTVVVFFLTKFCCICAVKLLLILAVETTYEGPRITEDGINADFMKELIQWFKDQKRLHKR